MSILDIFTEEIRTMYPDTLKKWPPDDEYTIHCSSTIYRAIINYFFNSGFIIPDYDKMYQDVLEGKVKFTKFQTPSIGYFTVFPDLENGYKIQRNEKRDSSSTNEETSDGREKA